MICLITSGGRTDESATWWIFLIYLFPGFFIYLLSVIRSVMSTTTVKNKYATRAIILNSIIFILFLVLVILGVIMSKVEVIM